jgi:hypothetical protein
MRAIHDVRLVSSAAMVLSLSAQIAFAQPQQKVSGPQARYWLQAETGSGFAAQAAGGGGGGGGFGAVMGGLFGGGGGAGSASKTLRLDLGATRDANPASGQHNIPAGMSMGASLPLLGPEKSRPERTERVERDVPEWEERDGNVRMLFFWGCGENAGPGQPVIIDTKEIRAGKLPPNFSSVAVRDNQRGPWLGRDRGYADWPNSQNSTAVPSGASLAGDHAVTSNISSEIRFNVPAANDYLGALTLSSAANAGGGTRLSWNTLERSLGFFATAMGVRETAPKSTDMVMWNSSAQRMLGGEGLMGFLPPGEVSRLVGERVVMPPSTTECVIPKQALEAAGGQLMMSNLNAFGPELNVIHPPRPQDPRVEWKQEYAVKLRTRSYTGNFDMAAAAGQGGSRRAGSGAAPSAPSAPAEAPSGGTPNPLGGAGNILRGIFGR